MSLSNEQQGDKLSTEPKSSWREFWAWVHHRRLLFNYCPPCEGCYGSMALLAPGYSYHRDVMRILQPPLHLLRRYDASMGRSWQLEKQNYALARLVNISGFFLTGFVVFVAGGGVASSSSSSRSFAPISIARSTRALYLSLGIPLLPLS